MVKILGDVSCEVIMFEEVTLLTNVFVAVKFVVRIVVVTKLPELMEDVFVMLDEDKLPNVPEPTESVEDVNDVKNPVLLTNKLLEVMLWDTFTFVEVIFVIVPDVETRLFVVQFINRKFVQVAFVKNILPLVKFKIVPFVEVRVGLCSVPIDADTEIREDELMLVLIIFVLVMLDSVELVDTKDPVVIAVDVNRPDVTFCEVTLLVVTFV